jgi:signal transduction histidine kinase
MTKSHTILVIDDDKKFSFGLVAVLKRAGYQVRTACNGVEGLTSIRAENPDMILCDVMMPPPNGIELKKELASNPHIGRIPFLFLTARTAPADKMIGLEYGADDYITKPFDVNELLARIQSVLRRDELGRQRGLQEMSTALEDLRTGITTNLSHEMRTPLTVLIGSLELALHEKFIDSNQELSLYIQRALSSADRLKFLIEDLEILYDIDQGRMNTFAQTIDHQFHLVGAIKRTVQKWETKNLNLQVNIHPGLFIYAPRSEFSHVVSHLVDNACKFSYEKGTVTVSARQNGLGGCVIEVTDEGPGIPIDLREKVFDRYYQIARADYGLNSGLGIGLTIARAFAQAMGGDIYILDSPVGCKIRMILPPAN